MSSQFNYSAKGSRAIVEVEAFQPDDRNTPQATGGSSRSLFRARIPGDPLSKAFTIGDIEAAEEMRGKLAEAIGRYHAYRTMILTPAGNEDVTSPEYLARRRDKERRAMFSETPKQ